MDYLYDRLSRTQTVVNSQSIPLNQLLWIYSSLYVNEKIETYVFDFDSALVAVGGIFGLYLGWSGHSIIMTMIDYFQRKMSQTKMPPKRGKPKSYNRKSSLSSVIKVAKGRRFQNVLE